MAIVWKTNFRPISSSSTPSLFITKLIYKNRGINTMGVQFGSFNGICETAALIICPLVGTAQGVVPTCYSRNVDIGSTLIFQPCWSPPPSFLFVAWFTASVWQQHVSYTSSPLSWPPLWFSTSGANIPLLVGKKLSCFSGYTLPSVYSPCSLTRAWYLPLTSPIQYAPSHRSPFDITNLALSKWFAAAYTGLVAAAYCCLLINGFVGFQFAEDGTPLSLWVRNQYELLYSI